MKLNFEKDIVFTTFATVASELMRGDSPLAKIHWFRIVLDEGESLLPVLVDYHFSPKVSQPMKSGTAQPNNSRLYTRSRHNNAGASQELLSKIVLKISEH